jgi:tRNA(Ile)-lysidine synthase
MIKKVEAFATELLPKPGGLLFCAVSGGADSMCMLDIMRRISRTRGFDVCVLHFNHELRGKASESDAEFVASYCKSNGVPCIVGRPDAPLKNASEALAREARYAFFYSVMEGFPDSVASYAPADVPTEYSDGNGNVTRTSPSDVPSNGLNAARDCKIATAHNSNDNAEQFLMRLNGIPAERDLLVRPLLCVSRREIERYNRRYNVPHIEDLSNLDRKFTRNRVRLNVMPELTELNPRFAEQVLAFTTRSRADDRYLFTLAETFLLEQGFAVSSPALNRAAFNALPEPIASRAVILCVAAFADDDATANAVYREHVAAALLLARQNVSGKRLQLPHGLVLCIERERLVFTIDDK